MRKKTISIYLIVIVVLLTPWIYHTFFFAREKSISVNLVSKTNSRQSTDHYKFNIPSEFGPEIGKGYFIFYFKYPDKSPFLPTTVDDSAIRVAVLYTEEVRMRVQTMLPKLYDKSGAWDGQGYFLESKGEMDVYRPYIGTETPAANTIYKFVDEAGNNILVLDVDASSRIYRVYRKFSENMELEYWVPRKLATLSDIKKIDNAVMDMVRSFQETASNN